MIFGPVPPEVRAVQQIRRIIRRELPKQVMSVSFSRNSENNLWYVSGVVMKSYSPILRTMTFNSLSRYELAEHEPVLRMVDATLAGLSEPALLRVFDVRMPDIVSPLHLTIRPPWKEVLPLL